MDFAADEDYYLVIDFTATRVYSDWYWEKNFYCAVKIFPAEAVSSTLMEANTGEFTQQEEEGVKTYIMAYRGFEKVGDTRDYRIVFYLCPHDDLFSTPKFSFGIAFYNAMEEASWENTCEYTVGATQGLEFTAYGYNTCQVSGVGSALPALPQLSPTKKNINIPSCYMGRPVVAIADGAFADRTDIVSVSVPSSVTWYGTGCFSGCDNLESLTFSCGLNNNSSKMFGSNKLPASLTSVKLVGKSADGHLLRDEDSVREIFISEEVEEIGFSFAECDGVEMLQVAPGNVRFYSDGNCIIDRAEKVLVKGCKRSVIPEDESVTAIGESAFYNQTSLESIKIPDGVKEIGMCAFQGCSRLKDITIADSVEKIGNQAFYQCTDLRRVELPDKMDTVKMYTFGDCSSLETVILPAGINWVEYQAFSGCSRLSRIYFEGTEEAWKAVNNADPDLARASLYFYSSDEPIGRTYPSSSYWHYGRSHEILIW